MSKVPSSNTSTPMMWGHIVFRGLLDSLPGRFHRCESVSRRQGALDGTVIAVMASARLQMHHGWSGIPQEYLLSCGKCHIWKSKITFHSLKRGWLERETQYPPSGGRSYDIYLGISDGCPWLEHMHRWYHVLWTSIYKQLLEKVWTISIYVAL